MSSTSFPSFSQLNVPLFHSRSFIPQWPVTPSPVTPSPVAHVKKSKRYDAPTWYVFCELSFRAVHSKDGVKGIGYKLRLGLGLIRDEVWTVLGVISKPIASCCLLSSTKSISIGSSNVRGTGVFVPRFLLKLRIG